MDVRDSRTFSFTKVNNSIMDEAPEKNGITKPSEMAVFVVLAKYADNTTRKAYPSIKTVAAQARVSERTVRSCVKVLESSGYITVERQYNHKGQTSNLYTLIDR